MKAAFSGLSCPEPAWVELPEEADPLLHTDWHANPIALGVQQAPNLSEVAVSLPIVLIHSGLQKEGVVGIQHPGDPLLRALHEHTRLLGIHVIPHALVGLIAGILGKRTQGSRLRVKSRQWSAKGEHPSGPSNPGASAIQSPPCLQEPVPFHLSAAAAQWQEERVVILIPFTERQPLEKGMAAHSSILA